MFMNRICSIGSRRTDDGECVGCGSARARGFV